MAMKFFSSTVLLALLTAVAGLVAIVLPIVGGIAAAVLGILTALVSAQESSRLEAAIRAEIKRGDDGARSFATFNG